MPIKFNHSRLRELRLLRGLERKRLAQRVPCHYLTYCRWERGTMQPSVKAVTRLALELGVQPKELWDAE